jgi:glycosyltransferase involved in cell wall biosynthesis
VDHTRSAHPPQRGLLIALHAVAGRDVLLRWRSGPRVAVVTGTDLNGPQWELALDTLERVDAIIALQPLDKARLPAALRVKTRVILPSVELPAGWTWNPSPRLLAVAVGHLRQVKEPLTLPRALSQRPDWTGVHLGGELEEGWARQLQGWSNFSWLGEKSRRQTLQIMRKARCFVLSSRSEGCSNALCEALALRMPVLATDIPGNRGLLGDDFPGYFPVGDASALAEKLSPELLQNLAEWVQPWPQRLRPEREADDLYSLVRELNG